MKKLIIAALALLLVVAFSITAMAAAVNNNSASVTFGAGANYDLSNNVYIDYDQTSSQQVFGIGTVHSGGNRVFATSSETSVLFWKTCDKGTTDADLGDITFTTGGFTGDSPPWSPL